MSDRFEYVKRGYNPIAVDEYIETLETVLKSYKEKDAAIKNAILNAQLAADNIIQNSKIRSEEIKSTSAKQLSDLTDSIMTHRENIRNFKNEYNDLMRRYLTNINESEFSEMEARLGNLEDSLRRYSKEKPDDHMPSFNSDNLELFE